MAASWEFSVFEIRYLAGWAVLSWPLAYRTPPVRGQD
jgi:hypothetical protein